MQRLLILGSLSLMACGADVAQTSSELRAALDGASDGDVVEVGAVHLSGEFVVPAGVTLRGAADGGTTLASTEGNALTLRTAAGSETVVEGIDVESGGAAGIVIVGLGAARATDVHVDVSLGVGIAAEDLASLALTDVTVRGPVTEANATDQPVEPTGENSATHGIVIVGVTAATLERVEVRGMAMFGALFVDSGVTWTDGGALENLGTGMMAQGGTLDLDGVTVHRSFQGFRLPPVFGAVFRDTTVTSRGVTVSENDGFGLLHANAGGSHTDLVGSGNANAALWVQETDGLRVEGASSSFADNEFAGVVVIDSQNVAIADASIERTQKTVRTLGLTGRVEVGDGLQLVRSTVGIELSNLSLIDNERAGLLLELDGASTSGVTLASVSAEGTADQLGVIGQSGTLTAGWDDGVVRSGAVAANDTAFLDAGIPLDIVEVVTPTDLPDGSSLASVGLSVLGVVTPTD